VASQRKDLDRKMRFYYGITADDYEAMLFAQNGQCRLCGSDGGGQRLSVDHCHSSGKVRNLLCSKCNFDVGKVEAWLDKNKLSNMIEYISFHQEKQGWDHFSSTDWLDDGGRQRGWRCRRCLTT
jgi:hypothetical protein